MTVRTRYAPSPTGVPHIGNIRTALFDYLLARHHGGQFVLRIEDTDRTRLDVSSIDGIIESLRWLGIEPDEGPGIGGAYGPYVQSERVDLYQQAARRLVEQGDAYECWCSSERLDAVRAEQQRQKLPPKYDRRCREDAGRAEARREAEAEGRGRVVRYRTPLEGSATLSDAVRGDTTFDLSLIDDFVILKSDGFPTYHLAYMIDDEAMRITHVLRGEEWLPSAPRHLLLYRSLGIDVPVIAHLPLILGPDGSKLSKRHGATTVFEYRDQGFLPEALFTFLGLLGWSLDDRTEIMSRDAFIEHFTLDRVVRNPAVFNIDKLTWMNGVYLRDLPKERLVELFAERLERDLPPDVARPLDRELLRQIVPLVRERVKVLSELEGYCAFFFEDSLVYSVDDLLGKAYAGRAADAAKALRLASEWLERADWRHDALEEAMRTLAGETGAKAGDLFALLRVAVTGRRVTPPLFESMEILGRDRVSARIGSAITKLAA